MHILVSAVSRFMEPTGICRHAANLAMALDECGLVERITFVAGEWQEQYFRAELRLSEERNIRIQTVGIPNTSLRRNRWFVSGLPELARESCSDVVHLSFPVPVVRGSYKCGLAVTLHDLYPHDVPTNFGYPNAWLIKSFLRSCLSEADGIACVSEVTQKRLATIYKGRFSGKSIVIPNVVKMRASHSTRPAALSFDQYVLCVAQHRGNKNLTLAVQGFSEIISRGVVPKSTGLVIIGTPGPDTARVEKAVADAKLSTSVQFLSSLSEGELIWMYEHCSLFLVTSTHEGFCLPLAEALEFGCPVVCSDIPILRETGTQDCCYFDLSKSAPSEIATAAKLALEKGRRDPSVRPCSLAATGQKYVALYSQMTGQSQAEKASTAFYA
jgi:glycosyltransferase involved in cell wall biosynthesis